MPRPATGQVEERPTAAGVAYRLRFRAYGERRSITLSGPQWTRQKAEDELTVILAQVRQGTWRPPAPVVVVEDPTFHEFASMWWREKKLTLRPNTIKAYENELSVHLLPFWAGHRLSQITIAEVDRYRDHKVREGALGPETINKTLTRLGQVLDVAEERGLVVRNPMRVNARNRKLKVDSKRPVHLDSAEHITALLRAAAALDDEPDARTSGRRALVATLVFAGLRVGEACALRWRDVNLAAGRIEVGSAKTRAGQREITLLPVLRDELIAYKLSRETTGSDDLVFSTRSGRARDRQNVRSKVLRPVIVRADEILEAADLTPLPRGVTPHKLRHTYASILAALNEPMPNVTHMLGHTTPGFTLSVYTHMMRRGEEELEALRRLVGGVEWPRLDPKRHPADAEGEINASAPLPEAQTLQGLPGDGRSRT